jgi:hypothetical protein
MRTRLKSVLETPTPTPRTPVKKLDQSCEELQGQRDHSGPLTIISIHPWPEGLCLAPPRTAGNGKGCVSQELRENGKWETETEQNPNPGQEGEKRAGSKDRNSE